MKISNEVVTAMNAIQDTAWVIDMTIVEAVEFALEKGEPIEGLIDEAIGSRRDIAIQGNARRAITLAKELQDEEAIYFPHVMDHRSRVYPTSETLTPQAAGPIKAMLKFPDEPLTEDGAQWLAAHVAAMYGHGEEKKSMEERKAWAKKKRSTIIAIAEDWKSTYDFWKKADEPFQFLSGAIELGKFMKEEKS